MARKPTIKEWIAIFAMASGWINSYLEHRERMAELELRLVVERKLEVQKTYSAQMGRMLYE